MMPVELNGTLIKELRGRTCRILSNEGWTQSNLGKALGVSQVMAGNYLHTLPKKYKSLVIELYKKSLSFIISIILLSSILSS